MRDGVGRLFRRVCVFVCVYVCMCVCECVCVYVSRLNVGGMGEEH